MILLGTVRERLGPGAVRTGTAFVSFAESPAGVLVRVRDRSSGTLSELSGDVLVGADGLYSQVRAQLHPGEPPPRWGGVMMWRGMMEGAPFLTGRTVAVAGTNAALKFVAYPISRQAERRGRALLNWVAEVKLPGRASVRAQTGTGPTGTGRGGSTTYCPGSPTGSSAGWTCPR
jgi:2-polyprenyl-6-methoxyphenol hydroxylase-like FAD-dependent oxidoreductase